MLKKIGVFSVACLIFLLSSLIILFSEDDQQRSKSSGILLGIKREREHFDFVKQENDKPQYKTLYITNNNGNVILSAQGSGILVPRNGRFWLVDIKTERERDKYKDFNYETNVDFISAKKANNRPVKESNKKSKPGRPGELAKKEYESDSTYRNFEYDLSLELSFVGNDYITEQGEGYCVSWGAHPQHWRWLSTIPFNEANKIKKPNDKIIIKEIGISELLGNDAKIELLKKGKEYYEKHIDEGLAEEVDSEKDWGLFRQNGKWVVKGFLGYSSEASRGYYAIFDTNIIPTKQMVGHDILVPDWNIIKTFIPDAKDAFLSPKKDMLVVLTPKELRVFIDFKDDYIGKSTYKIDLGEEIDVIMAQWSIGNAVEKWANEIKMYLK